MTVNLTALEGNLTADPKFSAASDGKKSFATFRIAVYVGKDGEGNKLTLFKSVKCFGYAADEAGKLSKGQAVVITGRLSVDVRKDESTNEEISYEYIIADSIFARSRPANDDQKEEKPKASNPTKATKPSEDEVPF